MSEQTQTLTSSSEAGPSSPEGMNPEAAGVVQLFEHRFGELVRTSRLAPQLHTAEGDARIAGGVAALEDVLRQVFSLEPDAIQQVKDRVMSQYG